MSRKSGCMATSIVSRLAPVTARDGVDTRKKDNCGMAAAMNQETTRLGAGDQIRGGQSAAKKVLIISDNGSRRRWIDQKLIPDGVDVDDLMYNDARLPTLPGKAVKKVTLRRPVGKRMLIVSNNGSHRRWVSNPETTV